MVCSDCRVLQKLPWCNSFSVRAANQRSTKLSQGAAGGSEVHVEARAPAQPSLNLNRILSSVVVEDQVHVKVRSSENRNAKCDGPNQWPCPYASFRPQPDSESDSGPLHWVERHEIRAINRRLLRGRAFDLWHRVTSFC